MLNHQSGMPCNEQLIVVDQNLVICEVRSKGHCQSACEWVCVCVRVSCFPSLLFHFVKNPHCYLYILCTKWPCKNFKFKQFQHDLPASLHLFYRASLQNWFITVNSYLPSLLLATTQHSLHAVNMLMKHTCMLLDKAVPDAFWQIV